MRCAPSAWRSSLLLLAPLLLATACSTPPDKEIGLAREALGAAEAAGADRLAPDEFRAARDMLAQAVTAVGARDFRLALSRALDAREAADAATALATERRGAVRAEVEQMLADIEAARAETQAHLEAASRRAAGTTLEAAEAAVATIDEDVQEARSALEQGDALGARERLVDVVDRLRAVDEELEAAALARSTALG